MTCLPRGVGEAGFLHFEPEVVALARPLAHAGEHRHAAGLDRDVADQLLHHDGLADAGAAEEADLASLGKGQRRSTTLMPVWKTRGRLLVDQRGRGAVDRVVLVGHDGRAAVHRVAQEVHDAPEGGLADRHLDGPAVSSTAMPRTSPSVVRRDRPDGVVAHVRGDLAGDVDLPRVVVDLERGVDRRAFVSNVTSTTGPMTCEILPMFAMRYPFSASAPPTMSRSSS